LTDFPIRVGKKAQRPVADDPAFVEVPLARETRLRHRSLIFRERGPVGARCAEALSRARQGYRVEVKASPSGARAEERTVSLAHRK
jgi:hypothetical protein